MSEAGNGTTPLWYRVVERFGVPTFMLIVGCYFVGWHLWPEHKAFLNRIASQQETQTQILGKLQETSEDGFSDMGDSSRRVENKLDTLRSAVNDGRLTEHP